MRTKHHIQDSRGTDKEKQEAKKGKNPAIFKDVGMFKKEQASKGTERESINAEGLRVSKLFQKALKRIMT